jgi:hypothetical protein
LFWFFGKMLAHTVTIQGRMLLVIHNTGST